MSRAMRQEDQEDSDDVDSDGLANDVVFPHDPDGDRMLDDQQDFVQF